MKFRKKPIVIEAIQWTGMNHDELAEFCPNADHAYTYDSIGVWFIKTLEGSMMAEKGDWIIKGIQGEFYPIKPDIFAASYEPVLE